MKKDVERKQKLEKLLILLQDLNYMQNNLIDIVEKIKVNIEIDENFMKLYTHEFNDAIYDINIFYKNILDLCVELYWTNPSYISAPEYRGISWD